MFKINETVETLAARHFVLQSAVFALLRTHPNPAQLSLWFDHYFQRVQAHFEASVESDTVLAAMTQERQSLALVLSRDRPSVPPETSVD